MKKFNFKGTGVAIATPFNEKGKIDSKGLKKLVNHLIDGGIDYIVALGTTGESATLNSDEKKEFISLSKEYINKRIPLVIGLGGNNTAELCKQIEKTDLKQIEAILSVSPYYNKPNQEGIFLHYSNVASSTDLPIILYNVPGRTGSNISVDTTLKLAETYKNIKAIKEASGNMEQIMQIIANKPDEFHVISGDDNLTLPIMACGGVGVISVVAMVYPEKYSKMVNYCLKGNFDKAQKLHYEMMNMTNLLFSDGSPGGVKTALHYMGICKPYLRLPLFQPNEEVKRKIKSLL